MIDMIHADAGYGAQAKIQDVNVSFRTGEMTVIVGPNGSGKSTLIKAIVGLSQIMAGNIDLNGEDVKELGSKKIARIVSYLPQNRNLPAITAEKMVLHGRFPYLSYPRRYSDIDYQCVRESMEKLGIWELRHQMVGSLSGGERQKIYLAMALAGDTQVLILDEPTTYLDISCQIEFMKILGSLKEEGKTIIVVLHDLNAALQYADRVLVMKDGHMCGLGVPDQIYESGILEEVFAIRSHCFYNETGKKHYYFD